MRLLAVPVGLLACVVLVAPVAASPGTSRVSIRTDGTQGDGGSSEATVSADGRYVVFASISTNLAAGDTNGVADVFVRDRTTGRTSRVSVGAGGVQADGGAYSGPPAISADGRFVAFASAATNLVAGDTNGVIDIFVRDRVARTTTRVNVGPAGAWADQQSSSPSISADGRYIAFASFATNLMGGSTGIRSQIFVRDRVSRKTTRVSGARAGGAANSDAASPSISADGRYVAFSSYASNLVAGDTNDTSDVFVRDRTTGKTIRVSLGAGGAQGDAGSFSPAISADGRFIAFISSSANLIAGDTNGTDDVFVRDQVGLKTARVSVGTGKVQGDNSSNSPAISADGRYVAFTSDATNLVAGDTNDVADVFVRDRTGRTTTRVSVAAGGAQGDAYSRLFSISANGRVVVFESQATNLVPGDTNAVNDVFVRTR